MAVRGRLGAIAEFIRSEVIGGAILFGATVIALIWANLGGSYGDIWSTELTLGSGSFSITEDLQHWVNDGLMVLFFFVIALEVKRELTVGELSDRRAASVPVVAAFGGVLLPAAIFLAVTLAFGEPGDAKGWAIPSATDIAFAVGVLALISRWVPAELKLLLLTIAVVDDIVAIAIIAIFYTGGLSLAWLGAVAGLLALVVVMRAAGVKSIAAYIPVGIAVWVAMLESGVHATIAGVAIGLLTPATPIRGRSVIEQLEHRLHPVSAGLVVPIFALANAGIVLSSDMLSKAASEPIAWGIVAGLLLGKTAGIGGTIWLMTRIGLGRIPGTLRSAHIWGMAALAGIGFTVSLFITQLSYTDAQLIDEAKLAVFAGSIVSACLGALILIRQGTRRSGSGEPDPGPTISS